MQLAALWSTLRRGKAALQLVDPVDEGSNLIPQAMQLALCVCGLAALL